MVRGNDQIGTMVELCADREPDHVAIKVIGGVQLTYRELDERATRLANALRDGGLQPGDRVAAWLDTSVEYVELYIAIAKAGLVMVPINSLFTPGEAEHLLADSGARVLVHAERLAGSVAELRARVPLDLVVVDGGDGAGEAVSLDELRSAGSARRLDPPDDESLFIIAYTSGTTGLPKGAMLTHRSVKNVCRVDTIAYRLPMRSVCAYQVNMSFVATVTALIFVHLYVGGTVVIAPKVDPDSFLDVVAAERCTYVYLPTPWIRPFTELVRARPERAASIRVVVHAGSKADPSDMRALAAVVGERYFEGWGMTETSGAVVCATVEADLAADVRADDFFASVGRPVADAIVEVVDDDGHVLPHDGEAIGELIAKTSTMMAGYWNNPDATAATLRDGWYHTGDLGSIDAAGYVYITERRNDLIVSGGINIYPSEIEHTITKLDGVADVAVVGVPHERWGQTPAAIVVREPGAVVDEAAVLEHCRQHLATYKKPSHVIFTDALPRSASNKVLRRVLRDDVTAALSPGQQ